MVTKWCTKLEVALKRCPIVFQCHLSNFKITRLKEIVEFDPNWAFPDSNSSLNSPMAMKCCTKLETAKERCPIVFQGHPSNFKVTWDKTSPILTQIWRFRTIGRSQLSNPSDLPCCFCFLFFFIQLHRQKNQILWMWNCTQPFKMWSEHFTQEHLDHRKNGYCGKIKTLTFYHNNSLF